MSLIDTYQLATGGQNFVDTFTLSTNGILISITIKDIVRPIRSNNFGILSKKGERKNNWWDDKKYDNKQKPTEVLKQITVVVTVGQEKFIKHKLVKNRPNLNVDDISVVVKETENKPKISITLKK